MTWKRVNHHNLDHKIMVNERGQVFNATTCREVVQRKKNGYMTVLLRSNGKQKTIGVHRLVYDAFHGAPPTPAHQPDHINGIRSDNRPANLEWVTPSTNIRRAKSRKVRGTAEDGSSVTFSHLAMTEDFGFNSNAIRKSLARKKSNFSQGFFWEYVTD